MKPECFGVSHCRLEAAASRSRRRVLSPDRGILFRSPVLYWGCEIEMNEQTTERFMHQWNILNFALPKWPLVLIYARICVYRERERESQRSEIHMVIVGQATFVLQKISGFPIQIKTIGNPPPKKIVCGPNYWAKPLREQEQNKASRYYGQFDCSLHLARNLLFFKWFRSVIWSIA